MNRLTLDQSTLQKLGNLKSSLEICDETGRVLGYVTPVSEVTPISKGETESPHSQDELRSREVETESFSTAEVIDRLENL